jgi:sulfide:quinone oxidoreductase
LLFFDADREELLELLLLLVEDSERGVASAGHLTCDLEDAVEDIRQVQLGHERPADLDEPLETLGIHNVKSRPAADNYECGRRQRTDALGLGATDSVAVLEMRTPNSRANAESTTVHKVVIAGGGVAALEALLTLRELAQDRVEIDLVTPNSEFINRPMELAALFRDERVQHFDLTRIAADQGATLVPDRLEGVWPDKRVVTQSGTRRSYDSLLIAIGAHLRVGVPGAMTVAAPGFRHDFLRALDDLERGIARRIAFAAPAGTGWLLPLYELALLTADNLAERGVAAELVVVTPEDTPLEVFGVEVSKQLESLLSERNIELLAGQRPISFDANGLITAPSGLIEADRAVALPSMRGPRVRGVPQAGAGFIATDRHGRVPGTEDVYAAGDGTAFPVKQGGLAAQQADAAAEAIAAAAGAEIDPKPFAPILRGLLLTGNEPHYLRHDLSRPQGPTEIGERSLWWPPAKVAARNLTPYLAARPGLQVRTTT